MGLFGECYQGLGKFQGGPYHIEVDPSGPPKMIPCRPVPVHQLAAFKQELAEMQAAGIIKPADHATPWINSFVIINKKQFEQHGKPHLHICLDPSYLNKATA